MPIFWQYICCYVMLCVSLCKLGKLNSQSALSLSYKIVDFLIHFYLMLNLVICTIYKLLCHVCVCQRLCVCVGRSVIKIRIFFLHSQSDSVKWDGHVKRKQFRFGVSTQARQQGHSLCQSGSLFAAHQSEPEENGGRCGSH